MGQGRAIIYSLPLPAQPPRPSLLVCPRCTKLLGVVHHPRVTIKPQVALVLGSGAVLIENPVIVCATCASRGEETVL